MEITKEEYIEKLQNSLTIIRKVAGWSTEDLGNLIGVTKQTISNIENKKTPMTLTQYIAIRSIIDYEIQNNPGNKDLATIVNMLVDNDDKELSEEQANTKNKNIQLLSKAAAGGLCGSALTGTVISLLSTAGVTSGVEATSLVAGGTMLGSVASPIGAVAGATLGSAVWLTKVVNDKKRKRKKENKEL